jgi:hypothetical protein
MAPGINPGGKREMNARRRKKGCRIPKQEEFLKIVGTTLWGCPSCGRPGEAAPTSKKENIMSKKEGK